jgi:hypothetical protein
MVSEASATLTRDTMEDLDTDDFKLDGAQGAANQ